MIEFWNSNMWLRLIVGMMVVSILTIFGFWFYHNFKVNIKQIIVWLIAIILSVTTSYLVDDFRISFIFSGVSLGIPLTTLLNNKSAIKEDREVK